MVSDCDDDCERMDVGDGEEERVADAVVVCEAVTSTVDDGVNVLDRERDELVV